jgi:hypothetical protein
MQRTEEMLDRARIYKYGVQHFLENETGARQIAVNILQEAVLLQKDAYGTRASIRNAADLKRGPETKIQEEEISPGSPGPRFNQK